MGTMIGVTSHHFLLQREDHAEALAALREFVRRHPADFRSTGELRAADLAAALDEGGWAARVDEHGDVVALDYAGDKAPPDASDDFPMSFFEVLAPYVKHGRLFRWVEGRPAFMCHSLGQGANTYSLREPGIELRQVGPPPLVKPGASVEIEFKVHGHGVSDGTVTIEATHSTQVDYQMLSREVPIGGSGRIRVTPVAGAANPVALYVSARLGDIDQFDLGLQLRVDTPAEQADGLHDVIAASSPLDDGREYPFFGAKKVPAALECLKRYAARYAGRPGAEFLSGVLEAQGLAAAFRAAQLECKVSPEGAPLGVRFIGARLPGCERYVFGLFASLRGLVTQAPWFRVRYAHDPARDVCLSYEWGEPARDLREP
ncbi:MAG: hypothetical protein JNK82_45550 [Myxococcaceae bacterium]|nr:hypothetical protein [Myxococcaceae bacterium]